MSLKNTKNLVIIAAVVVALTAGTVLLGNYTNILSTSSQPKTCQATKNAACTASQAALAENAEGGCTRKAECDSAEKACQTDCTKPCCDKEGKAGCCPKDSSDCTKPCEDKAGCCPKSDATASETGCCPKAGATVAAKTGCCPGTVTE